MGAPGASRRKTVAFILSGIFPGLGQFYNRQWIKGAAFAVAGVVLFWLIGRAMPKDLMAFMTEPRIEAGLVVGLVLLVVVLIWSLVDAWRAAGR